MNAVTEMLAAEELKGEAASPLIAFQSLLASAARHAGLDALCAIAVECSHLVETDGLRLDALARLVAGDDGTSRRTCRIEYEGLTCWSARYRRSSVFVERSIEPFGEPRGRVTIGFPEMSGEPLENSPDLAWANVAAGLIAQALSLKAISAERERTGQEATRSREAVGRAERLLSVGFWEFDPETSRFVWHREAQRLLGLDGKSALHRRRKNPILAVLQNRIRNARGPESFVHPFRLVDDDGADVHFEAIGEVHPANEGSSFGLVRKVRSPAEHFFGATDEDGLTELPNRRGLDTRLSDTLLRAGASGALVVLDVNRFGEVNAIRGSDFGDAFLRAFAKRLREMVRSCFIARTGNNEFAVLYEDMPEEQAANRALAFSAGMQPLKVFGQDVVVTLSVGVATFPGEGRTPTELIANASLALGAAKAKGSNAFVRFTPDLREDTVRRASLRTEVENGLAAGHFVPFYQPKISLKTGKIVGFEVLGRWNAPTGLRGPGAFISALEDPNIAREYFTRQLDRVLTEVSVWRRQGLEVGRMALNTSSSDYTNFDLAAHVLRRLEESRLPASVLGLEITETVILGDNNRIKKTLERLRRAGVEIALDDFGTGYASLTHLRGLPIDVVKIDRSFVDRITEDPGNRAIVSAVIDIGRALGLKIVAEGTETAEQVEVLKQSSCDEVQGYLYGKPMPSADVPGFIRSWPGI